MKNLFFSYLKSIGFRILFFFLTLAVFGVVYVLYGTNWEVYGYAALLSLFFGLVFLLLGFLRTYKKHSTIRNAIPFAEENYRTLPSSDTVIEEDLAEMVRVLGLRANEIATELAFERRESLEYYSTWVHQIKTPISVMRLILQSEDTEEHRELSAELFRIEQYVEMVLQYIRLGSGSTDFVFEECDVDAMIRQSIRKYASQFIRKKLRIVYEPCTLTHLTDEKWFCFLLEQILSNAVKYTYEGSVTILVTPDRKLIVRDTGIGIAPEDLPRIFEKGFTGYNGRADKKSTGLGLYLCKTAATRLGIGITAESAPGEGTAILLDLSEHKLTVE